MDWMSKLQDLVLDESAFQKAASDFAELSSQLDALRTDIESALEALHSGFNTPAGEKFINTYKSSLLEPMDQQKKVIEHISSTLSEVQGSYSSVFTEYEGLNQAIQSYQS